MKIFKLNQKMFNDIVVGTLIYSSVLGFMNDYTNLLSIPSYSTTFLAAFVLQLLIYPTFRFKEKVVEFWNNKLTKYKKIGILLSVWAIMFFSKFIFLEILDIIFGNNFNINGFISLLLIIILGTIFLKLFQLISSKFEEN